MSFKKLLVIFFLSLLATNVSFANYTTSDTTAVKSESAADVAKDTTITAKVKSLFMQKKIFGDKDIAAITISVETNNGVVSLSGTADNQAQIDNAIKIAKSVKGVKDVKSTVTVSVSN